MLFSVDIKNFVKIYQQIFELYSSQIDIHWQVRSRSVTAAPRWTALAWHSSAGAVQACRDRSPMSPESSTDVPYRSLHSHLWSRRSPAPTIRQTPTTECTTHPPCYRSSCHCIRRSDSLEFTAGQSSRFDCRTGPVSTRTKNSSVCMFA